MPVYRTREQIFAAASEAAQEHIDRGDAGWTLSPDRAARLASMAQPYADLLLGAPVEEREAS